MELYQLTSSEFNQFKSFIYQQVGISLSEGKMPLVSGRLAKRLKHYALESYAEYYKLITDPSQTREKQLAIDLLTTNETYFFREPKHFDFLRNTILPNRAKNKVFRVWSAASSSGEEPYSIAMVLADYLKNEPWEIIASDVSERVLAQARAGCYSMQRIEQIPRQYLNQFCLKGTGDHEGDLLISKELRQKVKFMSVNLTQPFPDLGEFDVVFLRNVMIYFDAETKQKIMRQMLPLLSKGGHFMISHSESLNGITNALTAVAPSIYKKPA